MCLKNNETVHITILFQTKNQNYNLLPSKYSPGLQCTLPSSSAMLPYTPGKISPGCLRHSFFYVFYIIKSCFFNGFFEFLKQKVIETDQGSKEVDP